MGEKLQGGVDPKGALSGDSRVNRGGSCYSVAALCRGAARNGSVPGLLSSILGIRVALVPLSREGVVAETIEPVRRAMSVDGKQLEMEAR